MSWLMKEMVSIQEYKDVIEEDQWLTYNTILHITDKTLKKAITLRGQKLMLMRCFRHTWTLEMGKMLTTTQDSWLCEGTKFCASEI